MIRALLTAAYLLLLAALWLLPADARMHHPARGHRIVAGGGGALDAFTQPSGAYSFRKLKSTYAGPAVRIRRASDNLELDINFLGCTGFTGCPWDAAAATAHCASTTCFSANRYDQGGAGLNLPVATAANQPQIIFNCQGALPCLQTTTATQAQIGPIYTPATGIASFATVSARNTGTGPCTFFRENGVGTTAQRLAGSNAVANSWVVAGGTSGSITKTVTDGAFHNALGVFNGAGSSITVDGSQTTGNMVGSTVVAVIYELGGVAATTCSSGEMVFWDNYVLTPAEIVALAANQKAYWGTP